MAGRWIDWFASLTEKTTTIDGTESLTINDASTSKKASLLNMIRYGGGATRNTTAGNATVTRTTDGALYLEVTGQTAGNARGAGAFDWQPTRGNATYVASGAGAVCIGANCTASATQAVALGSYPIASNKGQCGFGIGPGAGQAQGNLQTFYTSTTDATLTPLSITGTATDRMVIPATRTVAFRGTVVAMCNVSSSSNFIKAWVIEGVITRDGSNNTRIVGTPSITVIAQDNDGTQTPSTWAVTSITADDTNESLAINVTGQTGQTIRWQATLTYSQVGF